MKEDMGTMRENISAFGKRNVSEMRTISRDLTEKALEMRCQSYLADAKAKLLSQTIMEIDQSKKAIVTSHSKLEKKNKIVLAQKKELENLTKTLSKSNEYLENFAQVASHDLKSPLSTILLSADTLGSLYKDVLDDKALTMLGFIKDGAKNMSNMIDALLNQSKLENDDQPIEHVDMQAVLKEQMSALKSDIEEADAKITFGDLPEIMGNHIQLGRLLQNLLSNAIKYKAKDRSPEIHVDARLDGKNWLFSVADNGIGIANTHFDHLFDMFMRIDPSSDVEGTGIGLATCVSILQHHGGKIWVESTVDHGSVFFFTIPV